MHNDSGSLVIQNSLSTSRKRLFMTMYIMKLTVELSANSVLSLYVCRLHTFSSNTSRKALFAMM